MTRVKVKPWPQGETCFRVLPVQASEHKQQYFFPTYFERLDGNHRSTQTPSEHTIRRPDGSLAHSHIALILVRSTCEVSARSFPNTVMRLLRAQLFARFGLSPSPLEQHRIIEDRDLPDIEGALRWCEISVRRSGFGPHDTEYDVRVQPVPVDLGEQIKRAALDVGLVRP